VIDGLAGEIKLGLVAENVLTGWGIWLYYWTLCRAMRRGSFVDWTGRCAAEWPSWEIFKMQASLQKSTLAVESELERKWNVVDADGQILGRLAAQIAPILMGKHHPLYTPHIDTGDFVVVINAEKIVVTGRKAETKEYDHYTNHSGGRKIVSYGEMMERHPERIISEAVRRMLPKSKLGGHMLSKLKVYAGSEHPHSAQRPESLEITQK
jgi:large subunit ribosomal protein L13